MTVLCLVERDGAGVADASLRALTFARGLAGPGDAEPCVPQLLLPGRLHRTHSTLLS